MTAEALPAAEAEQTTAEALPAAEAEQTTAEALPAADAAQTTAEALPAAEAARRSGRQIALVGTARDLDALGPLRAAYAATGIIEVPVELRPGRELADVPPAVLRQIAEDTDAVLLVYPRRFAPRTVADGPTLRTGAGRLVPLGIIPATSLATFADAAAAVHRRAGAGGELSIALLAQRSRRYADLAGRVHREIGASVARKASADDGVFWWPAAAIVRDDLIRGLGYGLGLAVYLGHGRPNGWVGYGGVRAGHLIGPREPSAMVVSLACHTLSRRHTGLSFTEALVTGGAAAASLAAVASTPHVANARWSLRLAAALAAGPSTAGDLVVAAAPEADLTGRYRLIGDPLAPLLDAPRARAGAHALTEDVTLIPRPQREAA